MVCRRAASGLAATALRRSLAILLALAPSFAGAHTGYLLHDERLCDESGRICIRGWLIHDPHRNQIELNARLEHDAQPGTITIALDGLTPGGQPVTTSLSVEVRGHYSEIIHAKIIPQWPFETIWEVRMMRFEPITPAEDASP